MIKHHLFKGDSIILSAPKDGDAKEMVSWYADPEFLLNINTAIAMPKTEKEIQKMIDEANESPYDLLFHIRTKSDDRLVGFIQLDRISYTNGTCSLAIGIGNKDDRNKGYGTEAMNLILAFAFEEMNLHRVGLNFISYNSNAQKVYENCGFKKEGTRREFVHRGGEFYDLVDMSILRREWEELKK